MAAASNKRMTKEKIEVNDKNKKENERGSKKIPRGLID